MSMKSIIVMFMIAGCALADQFADYWYAGLAEVAVYDLEQSRYGEPRDGTATLIFVTEGFSKEKQVKLDYPERAGEDKATVLKLNLVKKYNTGIYPYSIMMSSFAEVGSGLVLKATTSVQEWCGHVFMQANHQEGADYRYQGFSYFESEGDEQGTLTDTLLAEGLFSQIRLGQLEPGQYRIVPSQELARTLHFPLSAVPATVSLQRDDEEMTYTISYDHPLQIQAEVVVSTSFPHVVQSWSESYTKGGQRETSRATLKTVQQLPYWNMNGPQYDKVRSEIGLE